MSDLEKLAALDAKARQTADDIQYYSGGSKHNAPLEELHRKLVNAYRSGDLVPRAVLDEAVAERDFAIFTWLMQWASENTEKPDWKDTTAVELAHLIKRGEHLPKGGEHE